MHAPRIFRTPWARPQHPARQQSQSTWSAAHHSDRRDPEPGVPARPPIERVKCAKRKSNADRPPRFCQRSSESATEKISILPTAMSLRELPPQQVCVFTMIVCETQERTAILLEAGAG